MTNYSRSVLKSNGLRHSKNLPVKFDFSPIDTSATIAKKLPPQRCFKPLLIPIFNFSPKRLTFAFTGESGYTTRLSAKDRTQRLTRRNRGLPSLDHSAALCRQRNTLYSATLLYTYISRFSVNPQHQQKRKIWQSCCHKFYPPTVFHPAFQPLAQTAHVCLHSESGYTLGFRRKIAHNGSHGETRGVSDGGWYHYPRTVPHVHKHPRAGYQNGKFCRFWGLAGCAPKERRKPSGQRCAYARRCPEASRPRWAA